MTYYKYCLVLIMAWLMPFSVHAAAVAAATDSASIAVVDVQQVVKNSLAAKDVSAQIEKKRVAHQAEIAKQEESLEKQKQELSKQRAVLSPEAFEEKVKTFKAQVADVQRDVQRRRSELDRIYTNALSEIQKSVYAIISKLSEERGFVIAIPTSQILFAKKELDISDEVLKRLNVQLPKIPLPATEKTDKETPKKAK